MIFTNKSLTNLGGSLQFHYCWPYQKMSQALGGQRVWHIPSACLQFCAICFWNIFETSKICSKHVNAQTLRNIWENTFYIVMLETYSIQNCVRHILMLISVKYTRQYHPSLPWKTRVNHQCQPPSGTWLLPEIRPPVLIPICTSPISSPEIRGQSPEGWRLLVKPDDDWPIWKSPQAYCMYMFCVSRVIWNIWTIYVTLQQLVGDQKHPKTLPTPQSIWQEWQATKKT